MADIASTQQLNDPANAAKVAQSISLIERGKAGIAGQDPALRPFVNALILLGARDISQLQTSIRSTPQEEAAGQSLIDRGLPTGAENEAGQSLLPELRDPTPTPREQRFGQSLPAEERGREVPEGSEPFLETRNIGTKVSSTTGREIPIQKVFLVDPLKGTERPATKAEIKLLLKGQPLQATEGTRGEFSAFAGETQGAFEIFGQKELIEEKPFKQIESFISKGIGLTPFGLINKGLKRDSSKITGALATSFIIPRTKGDLAIGALSLGGGALIGSGIKIGSASLNKIITPAIKGSKIQKLFRRPTAKLGFKATKGLVIGGIVGIQGVGLTKSVAGLSDIQRGRKLGRDTRNLALFVGGAGKGVKAFTVTETRTPLRAIEKPFFTEKVKTVVLGGKESKLSTFVITGKSRPPIAVMKTTPFRQSFGLPSKSLKILPEKDFIVKTITPSINDGAFSVVQRTGGGRFRFFDIAGKSKPINLGTVFPKNQNIAKFLSKELAATRTFGTPVSLKNVPKILGKDAFTSQGSLIVTELPSILRVGRSIKITTPKLGKTSKRFETLADVRPRGETEFKIFKDVDVVFKDISKPFARGVGKAPSLRGVIIETKEPLILDDVTSTFIKKPFGIKKTSLSQTFAPQKTEQTFAKLVGTIPKSVFKTPVTKTSVVKSELSSLMGIPRAVGGAGLTETQLAQARGTISAGDIDSFNTLSLPRGASFTFTSIVPKTSVISANIPSFKEVSSLKTISPTKLTSKLVSLPKTTPKTQSAPKSLFKQIQTPKLTQKLLQKQLQKSAVTVFPKSFIRSAPRSPRKTVPPLFPKFPSSKPSGGGGAFTIFLRRFGKFKPIGTARTSKAAFGIGRQAARTTLGATFKVEGAGLKIPSNIFGFKKKKTKGGIFFIEEPKFRLSTGTELKEIQAFRQLKRGVL